MTAVASPSSRGAPGSSKAHCLVKPSKRACWTRAARSSMPAVSGCSNQCGAPARAMPLRSPLWRLHPAACRHRRSAGTQATHPGRAARSPGRARAGTLGRAVDRSGFRLSTSSPVGGALAHQGQAPGGGLSCHGQPGHRRHRPVPGSGTALADAAAGVARGLARADKAAGHRPCGAVQRHRRGRADPPYRAAAGDRPGAPAGLCPRPSGTALVAGRGRAASRCARAGAGLPP